MSGSDNLESIIHEIDGMPDGVEKLNALENAIRLADQLNSDDDSFNLRVDFIYQCTFHGQQMKAMPAFSWCLSYVDREDTDYDINDILWEYKWICNNASDFSEISLKQIDTLFSDFKKRLTDEGYSLYSYNYMLMNHGITVCDRAKANEGYANLLITKRDSMADCKACVQDGIVSYLLFSKGYSEAIEAAAPILSGKMSCAEVPHMTYANLLFPAYLAGEYDNAADFAEKGYRLISKNPEFLGLVGKFLCYYAMADTDTGLKVYQKHLKWSFEKFGSTINQLDFAKGAALLFKSLSNKGASTIKLNLPNEFKVFSESGVYDTAVIADYHLAAARTYAEKFDKRNQNSTYCDELIQLFDNIK